MNDADAFINDTAKKTRKGRSTVARDARRGAMTEQANALKAATLEVSS